MNTHLIIGGLGFIGYNIAAQLLSLTGNKVIIYDSYKHFLPFNMKEWEKSIEFRKSKLQNENLDIINGDCLDKNLLKKTINKYKPEKIYHLAALPIPGIACTHASEAKQNIFDSTFTLLEILKDISYTCPKLIFASSSMVYGHFQKNEHNEVIPAKEDQECEPIDIYGALKLNCENLIKAYHHKFQVPYTIIRPSAVYGPTDCNQRVTEIFIKNALKREPLVLDRGGKHKLDFTYVSDTAKGFVLAANSDYATGETFNISAGDGRQIIELAQIIAGHINGSKIEDRAIYPYRPNRGALNIEKAKKILGYEPEYRLEEGIKLYLDFLNTK